MLNVADVNRRLADLRDRRKAALGTLSYNELNEAEKGTLKNIDAQIGFCTEQLREHKAGAHPNRSNVSGAGEFNFNALAEGSDEPEDAKTVKSFLRSAFRNATPEQQSEIVELAGYVRGKTLASANLNPSSDGGVFLPSFVASTLERVYTQFHPVVDVARLFPTDDGNVTTFPVVDDSEEAVQLDASAETGADDDVTGDAPPTALTGPQMKAYKISSKPVFVPRELSTDSDIDVVSEVIGALLARIIRKENKLYTIGNGTTEAQGFLKACSTLDATGTIDLDECLDLAYAVPALFRPNGVYMMADGTAKFLRKIKTGLSGDKRTIWTDANQREGQPATLHGYPVLINNDMASVASDGTYGGSLSSPVAFGDFKKFVVRQAEQNQPYLYRYPVPRKDGTGVILFRRSDSKLLVSTAIAKLAVGSS